MALGEPRHQWRTDNLADAEARASLPWVRHTRYHWSIRVGTRQLHYWPTTKKARWKHLKYTMGDIDISAAEEFAMVAHKEIAQSKAEQRGWVCSFPGCPHGGPTCNRRDCPREPV